MAGAVILAKQIELGDITYGTPRNLDSGAKSIPVFHKGKPLVIQTEEMRIPFGIRDGMKDAANTGSDKKTIEFAVDKDATPTMYDKLSAMDGLIVDSGMQNCKNWFRKVHDKRDVLEALYTPMLKHYHDKSTGEISDKFPPLLKANIPIKLGQIVTEVYDAERARIDIQNNDLKGARGVAILQCSGVWVAGGKFGCSWRILQLRVSSMQSSKISGYAFQDDSDDDGGVAEKAI